MVGQSAQRWYSQLHEEFCRSNSAVLIVVNIYTVMNIRGRCRPEGLVSQAGQAWCLGAAHKGKTAEFLGNETLRCFGPPRTLCALAGHKSG